MDALLNKLPYTEYCERHGSNVWTGEPINAISNLALFISAYFIWKILNEHRATDWKFRLFPALVFIIGIGSTAYHTIRNSYTHLMDAAPIYLFFFVFFYLFAKRLVKKSSVVFFITFVYICVLLLITFKTPQEFQGASLTSLFNAATLSVMFLLAYRKFGRKALAVLYTLIIYSFATFFRTVDSYFCVQFTIGTHFIWHILTALAAYFSVKSLLEIYGPEKDQTAL